MPTYFVDDGGDGSDGSTWAKAYTNLRNLVAGVANALTTAGNIIYIGADTDDTLGGTANHSAHYTLIGVAGDDTSAPVYIISSTVGTGTTVSYAKGTGNQIDTSAGAYDVTFDATSFAIYGLKIKSGRDIFLAGQSNATLASEDLTLLPASGRSVTPNSTARGCLHKNLTVNLTADSGSSAISPINVGNTGSGARINGLTIANGSNRTGIAFASMSGNGQLEVYGGDISSLPSTCGLANTAGCQGTAIFCNLITASSFVFDETTGVSRNQCVVYATNCGPADDPAQLFFTTRRGAVNSSTAIYRTGGAAVEGVATAWLITTTAVANESAPFKTPWIYGTVASTGSKTFDLYITNDTADFTDAECWLEVESLSTADAAIWALATDQRATITTTAAAQTDDTTSTWNGTGPSFTYKQRLSVTCTIGETGQYRARVAVGVASIAGSRYLYCDPRVTVS